MIPKRLVSRSLPAFILLGIAATGWADDAASTVRVLQDHAGSVMSLSFSPDGTRLATSSRDGTIKV